MAMTHMGGQPAPSDRYTGFGLEGEGWEKTKELLSRLAGRMSRQTYPDLDVPEGDLRRNNPKIPAGYTYLAQFVAHDLLNTGTKFPADAGSADAQTNRRARQLVLDCVYGGGPEASPELYEPRRTPPGSAGEPPRVKLRMGTTQDPNRPVADIDHSGCPHLSGSNAGVCTPAIADARNGDNFILSQITALCHAFHNKVVDDIDRILGDGADRRTRERRTFDTARRLVIRSYRNVIRDDLMPKLLDPDICDDYRGKVRLDQFRAPACAAEPAVPAEASVRIPMEFSHAAYRCGHAMVNREYRLNDELNGGRPEVAERVIDHLASSHPRGNTLARDWLIDWSRFFDLGDPAAINPSRRIAPVILPFLIENPRFDPDGPSEEREKGGLVYRDLVRAAAGGVRKVDSLIRILGLDTSPAPRLLVDHAFRASRIRAWLEASVTDKLTPEDRDCLAADPPLLFFVLLEAWEVARGEHLGPLGSKIVAEVIFSALLLTRDMEESREVDLERQVFPVRLPSIMRDIIAYVGWDR